jgi:hypothetical protein
MSTRSSLGRTVLSTLAGLALAACYPTAGVNGVQQLDTITTAYSLDGGWTSYTTFDMPGFDGGYGYIPDISPDAGSSNPINHQYDTQIMQAIVANFEAYGYTYVQSSQANPASFTVFVGANSATYTSIYNWWPYYCYYYPWYGCTGGWYWYPYPIYTQYDVGTLFIEMQIPDAPAMTFNGLWAAVIRGILCGGSAGNYNCATVPPLTRVTADINTAFAQSPYLNKGNP